MISAGWTTFKQCGWFFVGAFLLALVVNLIVTSSLNELSKLGAAITMLVFLANLAVSVLYNMGTTNFALIAGEDAARATLWDLWHPQPFWYFLGASVLSGLIMLLAVAASAAVAGIVAGVTFTFTGLGWQTFFVLFALLGIVSLIGIGIALMFVNYLVIARNLSPVAALKESARITKGHRWGLLAFMVLSLLVNLLGLICLGVGLLVSVPVTTFAAIHAYRTLEQRASEPVALSA
jgi:hypothetical protein